MLAKQPRQKGKALLLRTIILLTVTKTQTYAFTVKQEQQLEAERAQAATEWAPVIWLHPDEQFFPEDAHSFLKSTTHLINGEEKFHSTSDRSGRSFGNDKITPLREGRASWDTYLLAPIDTDCPNCPIPQYLFGTRPSDQESPQVYAVINSCLPLKRHRNRGRRTSHWNIINKHKIVSENDLLPKEKNGSHTPKEMLINQNNSTEQINISSEKVKVTIMSHNTLNKTISDINNTSSNISLKLVQSENVSNLSLTNSFSHLTSSHNRVSYNDTELENNDNLEEQDTNNSNNTFDTLVNLSFETSSHNPTLNIADNLNSTFALENNNTESQLNVLLIRDKRVPTDTNTDIPTENPDITTTRTEVTDEVQARKITEDENIIPQMLSHNDINQTLSSYNKLTHQQRFSVTYWMFYPYNHGKKVCSINLGWLGQLFKPRVNGVCHGQEIVMGNHVGDWEHVSIDFIDNTPKDMYISSHTFGAFYKYNPDKHLFYYSHQDTREGMNLQINFPNIVYMDNNHPVLYTALGSHGLWSKPGVHQYNGLPLLYDVTASGDQWRTWENLDIIDLRNQDALSKPHRWWLGYEGRWGNPPKNCHALLGGFCQQNHGPTGIPRKRINFHCTR